MGPRKGSYFSGGVPFSNEILAWEVTPSHFQHRPLVLWDPGPQCSDTRTWHTGSPVDNHGSSADSPWDTQNYKGPSSEDLGACIDLCSSEDTAGPCIPYTLVCSINGRTQRRATWRVMNTIIVAAGSCWAFVAGASGRYPLAVAFQNCSCKHCSNSDHTVLY